MCQRYESFPTVMLNYFNCLLMAKSKLEAVRLYWNDLEFLTLESLSVSLSYLGGILTPLSNCLRLLACLDTWISSSHDSGSCFL